MPWLKQAENYVLIDGVLYPLITQRTKQFAHAYAVIRHLWIPELFKPIIAKALHENNTHVGSDRNYSLCRSRYYWPGEYAVLRNYVLAHAEYQRPNEHWRLQRLRYNHFLGLAGTWATWMFPLGKCHIVVAVDSTSILPETATVPDTTAETSINCIFDYVISRSRHGVPQGISILNDNVTSLLRS